MILSCSALSSPIVNSFYLIKLFLMTDLCKASRPTQVNKNHHTFDIILTLQSILVCSIFGYIDISYLFDHIRIFQNHWIPVGWSFTTGGCLWTFQKKFSIVWDFSFNWVLFGLLSFCWKRNETFLEMGIEVQEKRDNRNNNIEKKLLKGIQNKNSVA